MANTFIFNLHKTNLFGEYWRLDDVKAVIVLVHGMGEHSSRYKKSLIPHMLEQGFAVITFDLYGHGKSAGKRGHCPSYEALLDTIAFVIKKSETLFPLKDKYLYGHSLGGNLAINYVLRRPNTLRGVIASSPFLRLAFQPPKWKVLLGKLLLNIYPSVTLSSGLDVNSISRDPNEVKRYAEDQLIHDKVSPMFSFPVLEAGVWAIKQAEKLKIPMLILHGTGDKIIDYEGAIDFSKKANNVELKLFEDGYHELHHDLCKEEFIVTILNWLKNEFN